MPHSGLYIRISIPCLAAPLRAKPLTASKYPCPHLACVIALSSNGCAQRDPVTGSRLRDQGRITKKGTAVRIPFHSPSEHHAQLPTGPVRELRNQIDDEAVEPRAVHGMGSIALASRSR